MDRRRLVLIVTTLLLLSGVGLIIWWWSNQSAATNTDATVEDQTAAAKAAWFDTTDRLVLFAAKSDDTTLYGSNAASGIVQELDSSLPDYFSNYVTTAQVWYSTNDLELTRHSPTADTVVGQLAHQPVDLDIVSAAPALAVNQSDTALAYLSRTDHIESIRLVDFETGNDTELYQGEAYAHYSNFTWSPDGSELAFTMNNSKLITITPAGAELHNSVNIPFHEFQHLAWLSAGQFGAVVTSADANPEPFDPLVMVIDRDGNVIERHSVFEKIGIPKVVWSSDRSQFLFYHPWRNTILIYDRYDQLVQELAVKTGGKIYPFAFVSGNGPTAVNVILNTNRNETTSTTNTNSTITHPSFEASAEEWERYNTTIRNIVAQWPVDLTSYRFTTTDEGLYLSFNYDSSLITEPAELVFVQTIIQIFAVLPDVPATTVVMNDPNNQLLWRTDNLSGDTVQSVTQSLLNRSVEQFFVINKKHPIGLRVTKAEQPDYHYVGDLIYSKYGDFNPYPTLSLLGAYSLDKQFYSTEAFVVLYPTGHQVAVLDDRTILFHTTETEFVSPTAWTGYGLSIKTYDAPGVTIEQWLSVHRPDSVVEPVTFTVNQPMEIRHLADELATTDEYVVLINNLAYVLSVQRDSGLTDADRTHLNLLASSINFFYAIQRN